jgi:hypothetical protein
MLSCKEFKDKYWQFKLLKQVISHKVTYKTISYNYIKFYIKLKQSVQEADQEQDRNRKSGRMPHKKKEEHARKLKRNLGSG